jgi:hypothetical protein
MACVSLWLTVPASAETRALLIGVSDYDDATGIADLRGPANDVTLLADVLRSRGVESMTLLADGGEGAERPTRAAILSALDALAREARAGDFVLIHYSGHGTRQADENGDEADGLDEVILPADTARAEAGTSRIPNAIVDDELGQAVRAIRASGADVWLILDSCHSGSGLRAAMPGTAARFVDPAVLGLALSEAGQADAAPVEVGERAEVGPEPTGSFLAFYSAQSDELAREMDFDAGEGEAWYGLFSATLAARLQDDRAMSFRQLFQSVLSDMNTSGAAGAAGLQTPLWEGPLIDAPVFGGGDTIGLRRFAVTGDIVEAGRLHGLEAGTLVGLVANAADPVDAVLGLAQVEEAEPSRAFLRPVPADCVPRAEELCGFEGEIPAETRFAQLIARPIDLVVRIGLPRDRAGLPVDDARTEMLRAAIAARAEGPGPPLALVETGADVEVLAGDDALWFGPDPLAGETPTGAPVRQEAELQPLLTRIARAEILARTLSDLAGGGSLLNPSPVAVTPAYRPARIEDLAAPGSGISPIRECRGALQSVRNAPAETLPQGARLKQCDGVAFEAAGVVAGMWDVNRVHVDAQFCVHASHERLDGTRATQALGPAMTICSDCPAGYSAGHERLFMIVTPAEPNREPLNLEGLVETCGDAAPTRGQDSQITRMLQTIGLPQTRGAFGGIAAADIWVEAWNWQVLPRREAFRRAGREWIE